MEDRFFRIKHRIHGKYIWYYYHYIGEYVVRQLGITKNEIYMMTDKSEISDVSLSESRFEPDDCITAEEFEEAWNDPLVAQKKLFVRDPMRDNSDTEEKFIGIAFIDGDKGTEVCYHFVRGYAVRILELTKDSIYMMKDRSSTKIKLDGNLLSKKIDDTSLKVSKVSFSNIEVVPHFYMTAEEFDDAWNAPLALQKKIFCKKTLQSDTEAEEKFIRIWLIIFGKKTAGYYHFVGDHAVRIIEITKTEIYRMNDKYSLKIKLNGDLLTKEVDDSSLKITDAPFPDIKILPENFITAEEFNKIWISPEEEQKHLFGNDA